MLLEPIEWGLELYITTTTGSSIMTSLCMILTKLCLQVAMMYELIGNGAEAEVLLRTGKEISNFHGFSVFCIVFTSFLGIYIIIYILFPWFISFLYSFTPFLGKHNS